MVSPHWNLIGWSRRRWIAFGGMALLGLLLVLDFTLNERVAAIRPEGGRIEQVCYTSGLRWDCQAGAGLAIAWRVAVALIVGAYVPAAAFDRA